MCVRIMELNSFPDVAIIVPVYNDPDGIQTTINSLLEQNYPKEKYNIYVVDNKSTDHTAEIIKDFSQKYPNLVTKLSKTDIQSSYAARNTGIKNSSEKYISFIDSDMFVGGEWLYQSIKSMLESNTEIMGCKVEITTSKNKPNIFEKFDSQTAFPIERLIEENNFVPTCCLFVKRNVFEKIGLFDSRLVSGGDSEFGDRAHTAGYNIHYEPSVTMYHPARDSFRSHLKKGHRIGRGAAQRARLYPERYETTTHYNMKYYSPPLPQTFAKKCKNYSDLTTTDKLFLYIIFYLYGSLSYMSGWISEIITPTVTNV